MFASDIRSSSMRVRQSNLCHCRAEQRILVGLPGTLSRTVYPHI
jgi:hypothetical protein